ncbi:MAG: PD-(D/E)XK nuclease family protein [Clostridia bacterium]|nr:PD-(D/E)XK nuclease family protein [Clostridia bacterium]
MLYLILASQGGGKTTHIMNLIGQFSAGGHKKLTLIVPEQFSFMSEKIMLERIGARAMADIDVLSFTSLGEKLVGKPAFHERRRLDDSAKAVLMRMALESVKDKLCLYGSHTSRKSVISEFVALSSEFKQNAVSTDAVRLALATEENSLLKMKLSDIVTVLDAYDAMTEGSYFNPDDLLTELYEVLPESDYFKDRLVFIDAFRGFTAQEYKVIAEMMKKSTAVYVTLCTDNLNNDDDETDLFAHTKRTAKRLIETAKKNGVAVAKPQYLSMRSKFNNFPPQFSKYNAPELAALEKELFSPSPNVYEDESGAITLCKAADAYEECEYIACTAKKLIRENGYRCRDIAVIARDSSSYEAPLRGALKKCGISVFEDSRQPVDVSPVVALVSSAVNIAASGFDTESLMRCLKTGLAGIDTQEISDVENYAYLWKINGSAWLRDFEQNPKGFGEECGDEEQAELDYLNSVRKKIISPLYSLREALKDTDGEGAAKAIFEFLEKVDAAENIRSLARLLDSQGETGLALELERMWDTVIDLLDSLETLLRGRNVTAAEVADMLELMLGVQTVGSLPQGLDEITIGSADRIRTVAPKVVFIAGANNGVFPAVPFSGNALTDKDRRKMSELGIGLSDFGEYKLAEEKLIAYNAFCCASDRLYVCCPEKNMKGEALSPSELYTKIKTLFPECNEIAAREQDGMYFVEGKELAFEQLAKNKNAANSLYASLSECFEGDGEYEGRIAALDRASGMRSFKIEDKNAAERLFGKDMYISASRVESYYKCPFAYFCRYGIKAMPRKVAELDPMQRGNVIHYALERLLTDFEKEKLVGMSRQELMDFFSGLLEEYLMSKLDGANRSERFVYLFNKLVISICDVAQRLIKELSLSSFTPVDFELPIGSDGEIPPYEVRTQNGRIIISGAVDRVDEAIINDKKYIRVVDYKSSGKEFALSDVVQGLNMQMFIYLFTLWQNGTKKYGDFTPAGVLYYPANSPLVSAERGTSDEDIEAERQKKCRMNGIILNDNDVITAMDETKSGLFVPARFKGGEFSGSLIGPSQLEKLKKKADDVLTEMADALHSGEIPAIPAYGKSYEKVCEYCDYKSVCSYEENIPVRELNDCRTDEVIEILMKEDEEDGNKLDNGSAEGN